MWRELHANGITVTVPGSSSILFHAVCLRPICLLAQGVVSHISKLFCDPNFVARRDRDTHHHATLSVSSGLPARPTSVELQGVSCSKDRLQAASNLERRRITATQYRKWALRVRGKTREFFFAVVRTRSDPLLCLRVWSHVYMLLPCQRQISVGARPRAALPLQLRICVDSLCLASLMARTELLIDQTKEQNFGLGSPTVGVSRARFSEGCD